MGVATHAAEVVIVGRARRMVSGVVGVVLGVEDLGTVSSRRAREPAIATLRNRAVVHLAASFGNLVAPADVIVGLVEVAFHDLRLRLAGTGHRMNNRCEGRRLDRRL
jgi:hypothetical protein